MSWLLLETSHIVWRISIYHYTIINPCTRKQGQQELYRSFASRKQDIWLKINSIFYSKFIPLLKSSRSVFIRWFISFALWYLVKKWNEKSQIHSDSHHYFFERSSHLHACSACSPEMSYLISFIFFSNEITVVKTTNESYSSNVNIKTRSTKERNYLHYFYLHIRKEIGVTLKY
jgi:hypothetical protein